MFLEDIIKHLPHAYSDHSCPLLLKMEPNFLGNDKRKPFRFQAEWFTLQQFPSFISSNRKQNEDLGGALEDLK